MKIILYHNNILKFGGVDTFVYNFTKKMGKLYDITLLYTTANKENLERIKKNVTTVEKYDSNKKYVCDICILASAWGQYPDSVIARTGRYVQMVHADYIRAKETNFYYKKWHKTTEHIGVSKHVCKVFKELYPNEEIIPIYNILDVKKETKPILKLISATRVSKEKGYNRMLKLAEELKKANIKFRWTIFTDLDLYNQKPFDLEEIVYMKPSYDIWDYIKEADYGVQLSDTEGYSYFINECLQYRTPVICTDFPSVYESVEDGKNGYILDMKLKNLDIEKIVNNIPKDFEYKEKCSEKDWINLLDKKVERKKGKMYKVIAKRDYTDKCPEYIKSYNNGEEINYNQYGTAEIKKDDVYLINDSIRAKQIEESGLAVVKEIKEEVIETANKKVKVETAVRKTRKKNK